MATCGGASTAVPPEPPAFFTIMLGSTAAKPCLAPLSGTRSCGRLGPARLGSMVARLKSIVSEYSGSAAPFSKNSPCALA